MDAARLQLAKRTLHRQRLTAIDDLDPRTRAHLETQGRGRVRRCHEIDRQLGLLEHQRGVKRWRAPAAHDHLSGMTGAPALLTQPNELRMPDGKHEIVTPG